MSANQQYRDELINNIRSFVEDGELPRILTAIDILIFPILRFLSFNEGVLRILVGGECVGYTVPFIKNTCNVQFANQCFMICREHFTAVEKVIPGFTHDED